MNNCGIGDSILTQREAFFLQITIDDRKNPRCKWMLLQQVAEVFMILVSSGICAFNVKRANWSMGVIS